MKGGSLFDGLNESQRQSTPEDMVRSIVYSMDILTLGTVMLSRFKEADEESEYNGLYVDVRTVDGKDYLNVEVLLLGGFNSSSFSAMGPGSRVLLLGLKNNIASVSNMVFADSIPYSPETVKAIPISAINKSIIQLLYSNGVFIQGEKSSLGMNISGDIISNSIDRSETFYQDGSVKRNYKDTYLESMDIETLTVTKIWFTAPGGLINKMVKEELNGTTTSSFTETSTASTKVSEKTFAIVKVENADGSNSLTKYDTDGSTVLWQLSVANTGAVSYIIKDKVLFTVAASGAIAIGQSGKEQAIDIYGTLHVTGDTTIDGALSAAGGNLTADK
jgi:hypothetical protein